MLQLKYLAIVLFLLSTINIEATVYYVNSSGDDKEGSFASFHYAQNDNKLKLWI